MGHAAAEHVEKHLTPADYVKIGVILIVMSLIEVGFVTVAKGNPGMSGLFVPVLGLLATIKFVVMASYYMHLKFDTPILRQIFIASMLITVGTLIALFFLFKIA